LTDTVNVSFEFLTSPVLNFILLPENKIRLTALFSIIHLRDIGDLIFDATFWYRFFSKETKRGDFVGVGMGIKNSGLEFAFAEKGKFHELYYNIPLMAFWMYLF
jgi:hypothetical protein